MGITDVDAQVMEQVLRCVYTDEVDRAVLTTMPEALLEAADAFGVDRLVYICEQELVQTLSVENAAARIRLAHNHVVAAHLLEASLDFIHRRFDEVKATETWAQLVAMP